MGVHRQAGFCARPADVPQHDSQTPQRLTCPVETDLAEQPALDRVILRAAWRVVADCYCEAQPVTEPFLKVHLPPLRATTIGPPTINPEEQPSRSSVEGPALLFPPLHDRAHGEFRGVV